MVAGTLRRVLAAMGSVSLVVLVAGGVRLAAAEGDCPGTKVRYEGKCLYPDEVEERRKAAERKPPRRRDEAAAKGQEEAERLRRERERLERERRELEEQRRALEEGRRARVASGKPASGPAGYVWIPAGRFRMGSPEGEAGRDGDEGPVHEVEVTRGFWLKGTEVTQGEWEGLMGNNPSRFGDCGKGCPVEQVSWWDAVAYCNALSRREGLEECYEMRGCRGRPGSGDYSCEGVGFRGLDCRGYRLPTEAEWEYAARAGTEGTRYGELGDVAWYGGNSGGRTHPVGQKQANAWGLHDMLGNVWEWVWDWYGGYSSGRQVDPLGPQTGQSRVSRGGSWGSVARIVRAANRNWGAPGFRRDFLGFRPARSGP